MRRIRTPFQPNPVRTVTKADYTDLKRQGLVREELDQPTETPTPPSPPPTSAGTGDTATRASRSRRTSAQAEKAASGESGADTNKEN